MTKQPYPKTSWEKNSHWYHRIVGEKGHYYHQHLVLPAVLRQLQLKATDTLLDLGCGQGVLARAISSEIEYWGIDSSSGLISQAKHLDQQRRHHYLIGDVTRAIDIPVGYFTHAAIILALQNMKSYDTVFELVSRSLKPGGSLVVVLNHPCFRIPRQSGWEVETNNKQMKRWVTRYMTPLEIPITTHPGKLDSSVSWSYHQPVSFYINSIATHGLLISAMEELVSDKESDGKYRKMENRSRNDIPLFMVLKALKQ